jgi:hypothetical protein
MLHVPAMVSAETFDSSIHDAGVKGTAGTYNNISNIILNQCLKLEITHKNRCSIS